MSNVKNKNKANKEKQDAKEGKGSQGTNEGAINHRIKRQERDPPPNLRLRRRRSPLR